MQLIPTVGVRSGLELEAEIPATPPAEADPSLSFGLTFDVGLSRETWFEVLLERQQLEFTAPPGSFTVPRFDVNVDYLHFGASYGPVREGLRPYVSVAAGLTHFGLDDASTDSSLAFSGSLAGGFDAALSPRLALRIEGRGYATFAASALAVTCGPGCVVEFDGSGWYQFALRAGLAIRL